MVSFEITADPVDSPVRKQALRDLRAGAYVEFEGRVRNHARGRRVEALEYACYEELARREGARILEEAAERFELVEVRAVHRTGALELGEVAVWVGVLAVHRDDAFGAGRYVIDAVKRRCPIWKRETYVEGTSEWVRCDHDRDGPEERVPVTGDSDAAGATSVVESPASERPPDHD